MDKKITIFGMVLLVIGIVLVAVAYAVIQVQIDNYHKEYNKKCDINNSYDEPLECINLQGRMVNSGMQFLGMSCGGGILAIIGLVFLLWGVFKKEAPAPGQYPPVQYPPQYPQAYPPQAPPPVFVPPPAYYQSPPQGQGGYYQQPPPPGYQPPPYPPQY